MQTDLGSAESPSAMKANISACPGVEGLSSYNMKRILHNTS